MDRGLIFSLQLLLRRGRREPTGLEASKAGHVIHPMMSRSSYRHLCILAAEIVWLGDLDLYYHRMVLFDG